MKKTGWGLLPLLFCIFSLNGCDSAANKAVSLSALYGLTALLSLALLVACCRLIGRQKWFILLFSSVLTVNTGYTLLALSASLDMALMANRTAYLGSVFLPLAMLMILLDVTGTAHSRRLTALLMMLAGGMFLLTASPGILPIYYRSVTFAVENGAGILIKDYGPLHFLYKIYLLGYFSAMVAVILRARMKKALTSAAQATILTIAVLVNIGVWLAEQLFDLGFEFLSISYIITELFLLGFHFMIRENQRLAALVKEKEAAPEAPDAAAPEAEPGPDNPPPVPAAAQAAAQAASVSSSRRRTVQPDVITPETIEAFRQGLITLTPTERAVYEAYLAGTPTKEILAALNIKENTLKFHNKNLYSKLGVSSRKQLLAVCRALQIPPKV